MDRLSARDTICWRCVKGGGGMGCSWVDNIPGCVVPGWEAEKISLRIRGGGKLRMVDSYSVHKCPLFEEDKPGKHRGMTHSRREEIMAAAEGRR